jgi:hypothetical protein
MLPRVKILENEFATLSADCKGKNRVPCESAMEQVQTDAFAFHRYLVQLSVPACLQAANTKIIIGLAYFHNGASLGIKSISDGSTSELRQAVQGLLLGYSDLKLATADINRAQC